MAAPDTIDVGSIKRSNRDEFRLTLELQGGRFRAELRLWVRAAGQFQPTRVVTVFSEDQLDALHDVVTNARATIKQYRRRRS